MTRLMIPDEELILAVAGGQHPAVAQLLERYWQRAYRTALPLMGGDAGAAEDIAQEAFVAMIQSAPRFKREGKFRPWFFSILSRIASKRLRAESRRRRWEGAAQSTTPPAGPGEELAASEESTLLHQHLTLLRPEYREALALRYLEGLSLTEIAGVVGCPEGTVSSRIRRGLTKLRESLEPVFAASVVPSLEWLEQALPSASPGGLPPPPSAAALLERARLDSPLKSPLSATSKIALVTTLLLAASSCWYLWSTTGVTSESGARQTPVAAIGSSSEASAERRPKVAEGPASPESNPSAALAAGTPRAATEAPPIPILRPVRRLPEEAPSWGPAEWINSLAISPNHRWLLTSGKSDQRRSAPSHGEGI